MTLEELLDLEKTVCIFCKIPPVNRQLNDHGVLQEYYPPVARSWEWTGRVKDELRSRKIGYKVFWSPDVELCFATVSGEGVHLASMEPQALCLAIAAFVKQEKKCPV